MRCSSGQDRIPWRYDTEKYTDARPRSAPEGALALERRDRSEARELGGGRVLGTAIWHHRVFIANGPAPRVLGVANVVLIHNHPSGDATPSREDLRLTRQLVEAGTLLDIRVHDHVIIGNDNQKHTSLSRGFAPVATAVASERYGMSASISVSPAIDLLVGLLLVIDTGRFMRSIHV